MNDPDDPVTFRQVVLGALFAVVFSGLVVGLGDLFLLHVINPRAVTAPITTTTSTTVAPTTTTTDPFAQLRLSLNDYCGAKGLGHAHIVVRNGAPIGGCSGR